MKEYPSIDREVRKKVPIYAFYKFDGSSIRAEWSKKNGWYKFGKRAGLIGLANNHKEDHFVGRSIDLFKAKYGDDLEKLFIKQRWVDKITVFFEFWGEKSFAGQHAEVDPTQTVTLFDISVQRKGLLEPQDFIRLFRDIEIAPMLYYGNATEEFLTQVREGTFPGLKNTPNVIPEGIVAKFSYVSPGRPGMFKYKTQAWLDKLKEYCAGDLKLFEKLL